MISNKNTRTLITLPKELKTKLEKLAKSENRSLNNYIVTILIKYLENK
jgi:predicted DNA-binding protein